MEAKIRSFQGPLHAPKVLVAPLDWGLGHATRCIPVIRALLERGCAVWMAGEPPVQSLLQAEFPNLPWLPLAGYRVRYGRTQAGTTWRLRVQVPRLLRTIIQEHQWLYQQMRHHRFDAVISDNRYGLHHPQAHCVFIGHQLQVQTPWRPVTRWLQGIHSLFIRRFDACWVPDLPGLPNLSGLLSHPGNTGSLPLRYVGPLSRMCPQKEVEKQDYVLLLLSGPEPQRSLLEAKLVEQAAVTDRAFVLVRGLPGGKAILPVPANIRVYNHLDAAGLQEVKAAAALVICRSGYSSVMDLAALNQKSILVPTPGQTEQQYLAGHLQQQGFALFRKQQRFDLKEALAAALLFDYKTWPANDAALLQQAIDLLLAQLYAAACRTEKEYRV